MTYRAELTAAMQSLAADPATIFIGYGIRYGRAMGTLKDVADAQLLETPVAEGLMLGAAHGLSLVGRKPVVYIERADFIWNAADALVNHLDCARKISQGEFYPAVIIRVTVGNKTKPLFTGHTHTQDPTDALRCMVSMPVWTLNAPELIQDRYAQAKRAQDAGQSSIVIEFKDLI